MYNYIIAGAGLAGSILARKLAQKGESVLVVERRSHIAGNLYDYYDEHNIKIQKYGPHVFHTNSNKAYNFLCQYCTAVDYRTHCEAVIDGINTPSPFNYKTIDQFYSKEDARDLKERLENYYNNAPYSNVVDMLNSTDEKIKAYACFLFEKDYRPYTAKQWNINPAEIDASVLKRVPIVFSYRNTYFDDKYEFIPKDGFTHMIERMLCHENITLSIGENALTHITIDEENKLMLWNNKPIKIIYTGAIDELFGYRFGVLPYRSLKFKFESINTDSFQNVAITAYPQVDGYTRITEYTKMPVQKGKEWTTIAYEYPVQYEPGSENEPYYPVLTKDSQQVYKQYSDYAKKFKNLMCCGRLADFKYYNMDQVVLRALEVFEEMEKIKW